MLNNKGLVNGEYRYDAVIPGRGVVVEFNGVRWHTLEFKHKSYHHEKREYAESHGMRMVSIWSDDWAENRERICDLLKRVLGVEKPVAIGARELGIKMIDPATANAHHRSHHIQTGVVRGNIHYGAFLGDELLGVASFRSTGRDSAVLARYTVKSGYSLVGLMPRLLKRVPYRRVVSYCDRDYFNGGIYRASGFRHTGTTLQLRYANGQKRYFRERFQRWRLPGLGIDVRDGETERQALARHGIHQCWNSGIDRYEWARPGV